MCVSQGDSGFLLVRDGRPFFKSPVLQHHFVRAPLRRALCIAQHPAAAAASFSASEREDSPLPMQSSAGADKIGQLLHAIPSCMETTHISCMILF